MFTDNGFSVKKSGTWDFVTQALFNRVPGSYAAPYSLFWHQFYASKKALNSQHSLSSFSPKVLIQPSLLLAGTFPYPPIHPALPRSATIFCCLFFNQTDSFVCVCVVFFFFLKRNVHSGLFSSQLWRNRMASFPIYKQSCWLLIQTKPNQERLRPLCSSYCFCS